MNRRELILNAVIATAGLTALAKTPSQTEGPFYPINDQADKDADLVYVKGSQKMASGRIVIVQGKVTDQNQNLVQGVHVEIWQACESGRYNHPSDPNTGAHLDPDFQYWGQATTDANGFYKFRTIIPGSYPADTTWFRPPHIHFKVAKLGYAELITQMYFKGEALNEEDLILQKLTKEDQKKVIVEFKADANSNYPVGVFDIEIEKIKK